MKKTHGEKHFWNQFCWKSVGKLTLPRRAGSASRLFWCEGDQASSSEVKSGSSGQLVGWNEQTLQSASGGTRIYWSGLFSVETKQLTSTIDVSRLLTGQLSCITVTCICKYLSLLWKDKRITTFSSYPPGWSFSFAEEGDDECASLSIAVSDASSGPFSEASSLKRNNNVFYAWTARQNIHFKAKIDTDAVTCMGESFTIKSITCIQILGWVWFMLALKGSGFSIKTFDWTTFWKHTREQNDVIF